jgi:rod shape-determining protein MreC
LDWGRLAAEVLSFPLVTVFDKTKSFFDILVNLRQLAIQNEILPEQVQKLSADLAVAEKDKDENQFLRDALGFQTESQRPLVPAEIIGFDPQGVDQEVTLNRGSNQGVVQGAAVVTPGNVLVGVVSKTFDNTSQLDLLTASGVVVNAEDVSGGATGVARGEHGLGLILDLVSQNDIIQSGDRVTTSGLGGQFPKNLLIGQVGKILSSQSELFQRASILPATDFHSLRFVFVIKK